MNKIILIHTNVGVYKVPAQAVAENRANYYAESDRFENWSKLYQEEIDYCLKNNYEIIDWMIWNSDWSDWIDNTEKVSEMSNVAPFDDEFWGDSSNFKIIEE